MNLPPIILAREEKATTTTTTTKPKASRMQLLQSVPKGFQGLSDSLTPSHSHVRTLLLHRWQHCWEWRPTGTTCSCWTTCCGRRRAWGGGRAGLFRSQGRPVWHCRPRWAVPCWTTPSPVWPPSCCPSGTVPLLLSGLLSFTQVSPCVFLFIINCFLNHLWSSTASSYPFDSVSISLYVSFYVCGVCVCVCPWVCVCVCVCVCVLTEVCFDCVLFVALW